MKLLFTFIAAIIFVSTCSNSNQTEDKTAVNETKENKTELKIKTYSSDFAISKNAIGEPVVPSLIEKCESIFGKGISINVIHSLLRDEEKAEVLDKAGLQTLSKDELEELDAQEFHVSYIHKGEQQLGIVRYITVDEKSVFVVYSSKNKQAYIEKIYSENVSKEFLSQFSGKGLADEIKIGEAIQVKNIDKTLAEKLVKAIRISLWTMQIKYNSK